MAQEVAVPLELPEAGPAHMGAGRRALYVARRNPLGVIGLVCVLSLFACGIFAGVIAPYDPYQIDGAHLREAPSAAHPFGTDRLGRDVLSRTVHGARISLLVGLVSVAIGTVAGSFFGILSGYLGKLVDSVIQRAVDVLLAFPAVVLLLAIITVIGDEDSAVRKFLANDTPVPTGSFLGVPVFLDIIVIAIGIGIAVAVATTRVIRGAVLSIKENVYIDAARAMGASDWRIMRRHVFPNVAALIVVLASVSLPAAILAEAAISFLGIGVPDPTPSWGADLTGQNRDDALRGIWWVVFFPGLALSLVVLGFNMVGDAFRDISDPRLRGGLGGGSGSGSSRGGL
ncbi:MAG: ABC transporter permease [Dehalococcoidia bacterium]|nr:ABC transporter permease [Dehalococcoidia bacterium]